MTHAGKEVKTLTSSDGFDLGATEGFDKTQGPRTTSLADLPGSKRSSAPGS